MLEQIVKYFTIAQGNEFTNAETGLTFESVKGRK